MDNSTAQIVSKVIQSLDSGVIVIDPSGVILIANPSARKHLKVSEEILATGKNIFDIEHLSFFKEIYSELMETEVISRREISIEENDETFTLGLTGSLIKEENIILGAVFLFTDLTEIKRLQQILRLCPQRAPGGDQAGLPQPGPPVPP